MAHSVVWGYFSIQKRNQNSKKFKQKKLSENGLGSYTKFGRAHLNDEEKVRHSLIWRSIWDFQI